MKFVLGWIRLIFNFNAIFKSKFEKIGLGAKELLRITVTVTVGRNSCNVSCQPCLPASTNVEVRGNILYKVILPRINSSMTRNPPEEWFFRHELPAQGLESHRTNGFPHGITSPWTRNPLEEWNSAGNHQFMDADSGVTRLKIYKFIPLSARNGQ
jgi:hypothetical protein